MSEFSEAEIHVENKSTVVSHEFGKLVSNDEFDARHLQWQNFLQNGEAPHIHYWDDHTVRDVARRNPSILIPVDLPAESSTPLEAYQSSPIDPFDMSKGSGRGAIIAAGLPTESVLIQDDSTTLADDAVREFIEELNLDDPDQKYLHTKIQSILREKLPENTVTTASSLATMFLTLKPHIFIPLMAARMVINGKNMLYWPILDTLGPRIDYLNDPTRYARLKSLTRPIFEFTEDSQLYVADVMQSIPEALDWLKKERGLAGNAVVLIDEDHAIAGHELWKKQDRQRAVMKKNISRMFEIRKELAHLENKRLRDEDIQEFSDFVSSYLGTVRIFDVLQAPPHRFVGSVSGSIPEAHTFVSTAISSLVTDTIQEQLQLKKSDPSARVPMVNDY